MDWGSVFCPSPGLWFKWWLFLWHGQLLHLKAARKLPSRENAIDLANTFAEFFESKIQSLRDNMLEVTDSPHVSTCHSPVELLEFSPTNIRELSSLVRTMAGNSCILDPVPGALLKDCYDVLLPVLLRIVNWSSRLRLGVGLTTLTHKNIFCYRNQNYW